MAHCRSLVVHSFIDGVERLRVDSPALYPVMKRLSDLFALHGFEKVTRGGDGQAAAGGGGVAVAADASGRARGR